MSNPNLLVIPCLSDNYAYVLRDPISGDTALFDAPDAAPILDALSKAGWSLTHLFITHHHDDHVAGVAQIRAAHNPKVIGAAADSARLPALDVAVNDGELVPFGGGVMQVIDTPGHTVGHVSYYFEKEKMLFSGDSLFALGCGRLFEGDAKQMWSSLSKLAALPDDVQVCFGHEYTVANADFALDVDPNNAALRTRVRQVIDARRAGAFTAPSLLGDERASNPFLRAGDPALKAALNLPNAEDWEVFAEIRRRKDAA